MRRYNLSRLAIIVKLDPKLLFRKLPFKGKAKFSTCGLNAIKVTMKLTRICSTMSLQKHRSRHPLWILLLCLMAILVLALTLIHRTKHLTDLLDKSSSDELYCHEISSGPSLPDISDNPPSVNKRNIFFLETSCSSFDMGKLFIKPRQACAVESAARMNPNMDVYLLFASPCRFIDENSESDRMLKILSSYSNIKMFHFDVPRFVKGTPVEALWTTGEIKTSIYPMAHTSDILRLLTLWKFGGIYLDLDVVVMKNLEQFPDNFGGAQSETLIANGVMGFSKFGKGREYIDECMADVNQNFDGKNWDYNGPKLISRNVFSHCPEFDTNTIIRFGKCEEFRIFPPSAFYMVPYPKWEWFFQDNLTDIIESNVEERSYMIHVWNKFSFEKKIPKTAKNVLYLKVASKYCPGIVQELDEEF